MSLAVFSSYSPAASETTVHHAAAKAQQPSMVAQLVLAVRRPQSGPRTPVQAAMMALFCAVMGFYAEHRALPFDPGLLIVILGLRTTVASESLEKQRRILAAAADFSEQSVASCAWHVQEAIEGAKAALRASWEDEAKQRRAEQG